MEIKKDNGKLKTLNELYEEAKEKVIDELNTMDTDDILYLGNYIRANNSYDTLYENNNENLNDVLNGMDPAALIRMGNDDWDEYSDFFTYNYDLNMTDDVWYDLDIDEIAGDILDGNYRSYLTSDIVDIVDDYEETKDLLENYNPLRAEGVDLLAKYVNGKADVTDLLQYIDRLVKDERLWEE